MYVFSLIVAIFVTRINVIQNTDRIYGNNSYNRQFYLINENITFLDAIDQCSLSNINSSLLTKGDHLETTIIDCRLIEYRSFLDIKTNYENLNMSGQFHWIGSWMVTEKIAQYLHDDPYNSINCYANFTNSLQVEHLTTTPTKSQCQAVVIDKLTHQWHTRNCFEKFPALCLCSKNDSYSDNDCSPNVTLEREIEANTTYMEQIRPTFLEDHKVDLFYSGYFALIMVINVLCFLYLRYKIPDQMVEVLSFILCERCWPVIDFLVPTADVELKPNRASLELEKHMDQELRRKKSVSQNNDHFDIGHKRVDFKFDYDSPKNTTIDERKSIQEVDLGRGQVSQVHIDIGDSCHENPTYGKLFYNYGTEIP